MRRRAVLTALVVLLGGCVHYPSVMDAGGVRIRTENGRAVRDGSDLIVTCDIVSSGKYGDVVVDVTTPAAKQARLVRSDGSPVARLEVPGAVTVRLTPDGTRIVLSDLQHPVERGETFIVTLMFAKSGGVGIVTLLQ
jgi:copper(I)-binding protein